MRFTPNTTYSREPRKGVKKMMPTQPMAARGSRLKSTTCADAMLATMMWRATTR
jgi:hypothetical protein